MDIVRTGIGISKTIKNVSRFREIVSVFAKNGFDEFISQTNITNFIPGFVIPKSVIKSIDKDIGNRNFPQLIGYRLRKSFEELGPSFIKLGQLLASREDIFPPSLIGELKQLQNNVSPIDFKLAKQVIEDCIETSIEDAFESIEETPIGVASIGVVYKAKLKTGDQVVIKVRRPDIVKSLNNDFEIIQFVIHQLEKVSLDLKYLGVSRAIDEFFKSIHQELNFLIEANNCEKLAQNLIEIDKEHLFEIPKVYKEYTSEKMIVMSFLPGKPFNQIKSLKDEDEKLEEKMIKCVRLFTHTLLADGFFHADLHGGNFILMPNGKIGLLDFGLMGNLSKKNKLNLISIIYALVKNDYENLVYEFLDVADYDSIPDHEKLVYDVKNSLAPFLGMSVKDIDITAMVHSIVSTLSAHEIYLPREWFIIFRSLMTLDGVGKSIGINLNIFEILDEEIVDIVAEVIDKDALLEEALWTGKDILNSIKILPRHLKWILKEFAKKKYVVDINIESFKSELDSISKGLYFIGLTFAATIFFVSGVFLLRDGVVVNIEQIPTITWFLWVISTAFFFKAFSLMKKY